ncbi:YybH family protein [Mumia quercus]|uniref:YybH family protein n=1 Tax=Mumia quercus TaxID=2976125 RepID=UPI0021CFF82C|nr:nuclear transport factor 2 family protein [Mumia quercus]
MSTASRQPLTTTPPDPRTPDALGAALADRLHAGDLDGLVALYEPSAVLELPDGSVATGHAQIRDFYERVLAREAAMPTGVQRRPLVQGDLALTTTVLPRSAGAGSATCEVARRQPDGTWRWIIDRPSVR